jgi:hypothetical protein
MYPCHIKDREHIVMPSIPTILASLHHLSIFDSQEDWSREQREEQERARRQAEEGSRRRNQEQEENDQEDERRRRRAQQAEIDRVEAQSRRRQEQEEEEQMRRRDQQAGQDTTQTDPLPVVRYNFNTCITDTSKDIEDYISRFEEEMQEIQRNLTDRITVLTGRLRKLKEDLATKKQEEWLQLQATRHTLQKSWMVCGSCSRPFRRRVRKEERHTSAVDLSITSRPWCTSFGISTGRRGGLQI